MAIIWTFDVAENKWCKLFRDERFRKFCESLREHAMEIIDFEKNKIIPLTSRT